MSALSSTPPPADRTGAVRVDHPERKDALRWMAIALCSAAAVALVPMWASLVLAAWFAALGRPLLVRLTGTLGGRERAAGVLTVILLLLLLTPFVIAVA